MRSTSGDLRTNLLREETRTKNAPRYLQKLTAISNRICETLRLFATKCDTHVAFNE